MITVDLDGPGAGRRREAHLRNPHAPLAYELRPEVGAVVHAHLPYATACTLAGIDLLEPILPEVVITLGGHSHCALCHPRHRAGAGVHPGIHPGI